ncbi:MAG TPA: hypothetical protein VH597_06530 [Verrucomicrobiae bacterium]|jgi:hypothetical protein|nr:hypothetical protein [Verrucomicrobiae bacterium]
MKILLQHTQTLLFLRPDGTWTRHATEARNFSHSQTAINYAFERQMADVYITVKFPGDSETVAIPLPAECPAVTTIDLSETPQARV